MKPSISVVIPCYNVTANAALLRDALASIASQTLPPNEIILVNDGSSDQTSALLEDLSSASPTGHPPVRICNLEENGGTSLARNAGIRAASGDLIAFLDFDDIWLSAYLESVVNLFSHDSEAMVVLSSTLFYSKFGNSSRARQSVLPEELSEMDFEHLASYFLQHNFDVAMGSAVVCRKQLFEQFPNMYYDPFLSKRTAEDVQWAYTLLQNRLRPLLLRQPLVIHRTYFRSNSRSTSAFFHKNELEVYEYILKQSMQPLAAQVIAAHPSCETALEEQFARSKRGFQMKYFLLEARWQQVFELLRKYPRLLRTIIRVAAVKACFVLRLQALPLLYLYLRSRNESKAKHTAEQELSRVRALWTKQLQQ